MPPPCPIEFVISDVTKQNIFSAVNKFENLMSSHTLDVLEYHGYGARVIKTQELLQLFPGRGCAAYMPARLLRSFLVEYQ
jgi:hypothetical protein